MVKHVKWFAIERLLVLLFVMYLLTVWNVMSDNDNVVSALFVLSFFCVLLIFIPFVRRNVDSLFVIVLTIIILSFVSVFYSGISNGIGMSFSGLNNYLSFCSTILYMYVMGTMKIHKRIAKILIAIGVMVALLYPIGCVYFGFTMNTTLFTMNFSNPNLTGLFILQSIFYCVLGSIVFKKKITRTACLLLVIVNISLMLRTEARNCIISLALFLLILIWFRTKRSGRINNHFLAFLSLFPLIFVFVYLKFISRFKGMSTLNYLVSEGKKLESREWIWNNIFSKLQGHYLFGDYYVCGGNAHNSHLAILAGFGIIVLVLSVIFIYKIMVKVNYSCKSFKQAGCLAAFCGTIFMGMGEGALFCGSIGLYIPACTFLLLAHVNWDTNE